MPGGECQEKDTYHVDIDSRSGCSHSEGEEDCDERSCAQSVLHLFQQVGDVST